MRIITESKDGFDIQCGPYGASRIGIEHNGKVICWGAWADRVTVEGKDYDEVLMELVHCYNLKHKEPANG